MLGCDIGRKAGPAADRRCRTRVDYGTGPSRDHTPQYIFQAQKNSSQVDGLQLVENVLGVIIDWRNDPFDTGIVRERVDWTKRRLGGLDEAGDLGRVRDVGFEEDGSTPGRFHEVRRRPARIGVAVDHRNIQPACRQFDCNGAADAATAARDQADAHAFTRG